MIDNKKILIYRFIASVSQNNREAELDAQNTQCLAYVEEYDAEIESIFTDVAIKGGLFTRPGIAALLKHIEDHPDNEYVVLLDSLEQVGRNLADYLKFKEELGKLGALILCMNDDLSHTPEGDLIECITLALRQYEDEKENG